MSYSLSDAKDILSGIIKKGELIILAGSGISVNSDLPNWDGLLDSFLAMAKSLSLPKGNEKTELDKIINDAEKRKKKNRLEPIKTATVLKNKIKECKLEENYRLAYSEYESWVTREFKDRIPNEYHDLIVQTNYPFILTTNYDLLLEQAAHNFGFEKLANNTYTFKDELKIMSSIQNSIPSIIHVHGSTSDLSIDELIFTKEDYNKLIQKRFPGFSFALRMLFTRYSTLYVGYGASDPHLEEVIEEISEYFPPDKDDKYKLPESYLVILKSKVDSILEKWKDRVRTNIIAIDDYQQCEELLLHLKKISPRAKEVS